MDKKTRELLRLIREVEIWLVKIKKLAEEIRNEDDTL